jgi:hypothetical protein
MSNRLWIWTLMFGIIVSLGFLVHRVNFRLAPIDSMFTSQLSSKATVPSTVSTVKTTTTTTPTHPMLLDPEVNICYSLKSFVMPEDILDLNGVAVGRPVLNSAAAPTNVTFHAVHTILYGDPATKLIYTYANKHLPKVNDHSYPHTSLNADIFHLAIKKLDPQLKLQFVVEIGSFTGNSASHMGNVLKKEYPDAFLLCIDTWLGGEHARLSHSSLSRRCATRLLIGW